MTVVDRVTLATPEHMHEFGVALGRTLRAGDLVILTGPLGAGKTTLTRGIGEGLGVRGPVQSPTFVIARTHPSLVGGAPLTHVDAYRLADATEVEDLDLDFDGTVVVAEWGEGLAGMRDSWLELVIERPLGGQPGATDLNGVTSSTGAPGAVDDIDDAEAPVEPRIITLTGHGERWQNGVLP